MKMCQNVDSECLISTLTWKSASPTFAHHCFPIMSVVIKPTCAQVSNVKTQMIHHDLLYLVIDSVCCKLILLEELQKLGTGIISHLGTTGVAIHWLEGFWFFKSVVY